MLMYLTIIDSKEGQQKFEFIYNRYKKLMFYIANKILGDTRDSEDSIPSTPVNSIANINFRRKHLRFITPSVPFAERRIIEMKKFVRIRLKRSYICEGGSRHG